MSTVRNFTIHSSNTKIVGGIFTGKSPFQAASKAASKLLANHKIGSDVHFFIRETKYSDSKYFSYIAFREKLAVPIVRVIKASGDRPATEYKIQYKNHVRAAPQQQL